MEAQRDFRELLALFNAHKVDYMIVGAYALAYHGAPRWTGDMDILVELAPCAIYDLQDVPAIKIGGQAHISG